MLEATGALDVYFEDEIQILFRPGQEPPIAAVKEALSEKGVAYTRVSATE